jgi:DNA-binding response OmpR family regulator
MSQTILVVDDDPIVLTIMRKTLEREGYRVFTATDVNTGLALAERETPSLVFVDLLMPVRSGFQLVERLKARPNAVPRVVMITASEGERPQAHALKLGVDDYLRKPLEVEQILATVRRFCPLTPDPPDDPTKKA